MKIRRLTLKVKLTTPHSHGINGFDAEITERAIIAPIGKLGDVTDFEEGFSYVEIDMYRVSKTFQKVFKNDSKVNLNLTAFSNGIYFVKIATDAQSVVKKILKN